MKLIQISLSCEFFFNVINNYISLYYSETILSNDYSKFLGVSLLNIVSEIKLYIVFLLIVIQPVLCFVLFHIFQSFHSQYNILCAHVRFAVYIWRNSVAKIVHIRKIRYYVQYRIITCLNDNNIEHLIILKFSDTFKKCTYLLMKCLTNFVYRVSHN